MKLIVSAFNTPIGELEVMHDEQHIHRALFTKTVFPKTKPTKFCSLIKNELECYFSNPFYRFQLSLKPHGTAYQQRVWNELLVIPVGRTLSYGELSARLQSSPRAVGQACKNNPLALFIPCHRVVGKNNVGGYMGQSQALSYKIALLEHEGSNKHPLL
jgi:methylated-DNA-[protein]-cysteine S-methyltransferase